MYLKTLSLNNSYKEWSKMIDVNAGKLFNWEIETELLYEALTHPNYASIDSTAKNFERLEFLGDAVLDILVAEWLYQHIEEEVGFLSQIRSLLVKTDMLAKLGKEIHLKKYMITQPKYRITKTDIEDCFEALFGALYLSKGIEAIRTFFNEIFMSELLSFKKASSTTKGRQKILDLVVCEKNPINILQEYCQKRAYDLPKYRIVQKKGEEHEPVYFFECSINFSEKEYIGKGKGGSKKIARSSAAGDVLKKINYKEK